MFFSSKVTGSRPIYDNRNTSMLLFGSSFIRNFMAQKKPLNKLALGKNDYSHVDRKSVEK
jgi:hypothetical protein